ncbi:MAG: nucleoid-associated protein, partial [Chitinophagaceae bacterium]
MTGTDSVALQEVIVHKIGNPTRGEEIQLSQEALRIEDEIVSRLLTRYFLGAFNENELYQFTHLSDLALNEVYTYVGRMFEERNSFIEQSKLLAQFLYSKSTHARVKEGELYIARFDKVPFEKGFIEAIGLFKSEHKETFLKIFPRDNNWEMTQEEGININKLDKGCLIFKTNTAEGFKVCVVDNTN